VIDSDRTVAAAPVLEARVRQQFMTIRGDSREISRYRVRRVNEWKSLDILDIASRVSSGEKLMITSKTSRGRRTIAATFWDLMRARS